MNKCDYQAHSQQQPSQLVVCICNRPAAAISCRTCGNEFFGRLTRRCAQHPNVIQLMDLQECANRQCRSVDLDEKSTSVISAPAHKSTPRTHPPPPPHKRISFIADINASSGDVEMRSSSTSPTRTQSAMEIKKMIAFNNNNNDDDAINFVDSANGISDDEGW